MSVLRICPIQYSMQEAYCLFFAFQLRKSVEIVFMALEENVVSYRTYKKWYQNFKTGNFNLEDDDCSGASRKFNNDELEELLNRKSDPNARRISRHVILQQCSAICCKRNAEYNLCIKMGSPITYSIFSRPDFIRLIIFFGICNIQN